MRRVLLALLCSGCMDVRGVTIGALPDASTSADADGRAPERDSGTGDDGNTPPQDDPRDAGRSQGDAGADDGDGEDGDDESDPPEEDDERDFSEAVAPLRPRTAPVRGATCMVSRAPAPGERPRS